MNVDHDVLFRFKQIQEERPIAGTSDSVEVRFQLHQSAAPTGVIQSEAPHHGREFA
jgi:hypothetical protein